MIIQKCNWNVDDVQRIMQLDKNRMTRRSKFFVVDLNS